MSNGPPSLGVSPLATAGSVPNESDGLYPIGHPNNSHNHRHISNCPNNMQNYPQQQQQQQREQHPSPHAHHHRQQQSQQSQQQQQQCAQSPTVIPQYHQHNHPPHQSSPAQASISSSSGYSHQLVTHHSNPTIHNHHQYNSNHSGSGTGANNSQSLANSIKAKYNNSSGGNHHRSSNADPSGQALFLPPGQTVSTISADSAFSAISPLSSADTISNNPCHNPNNNNPNNNNPSPVPGPNLASSHSMGNTHLTAAQIQARLSLAPDHLLLKHDQLDQEQQEFQHLPMQQLSFSGSNYSQQHARVDGDGGGGTGHHLSQSVQPLCPSTSSSLPPINNHSISPESTLPTISTVPGPNLLKVRRYKLFPGRNRFFCKGRIVMAKQISVFYFTLTLLTCTCTLFFVFDCPFLATKVSPIIPAVAVALFFFVLFALLRTSFTDPGIIPRATAEEAADIERQIVPNLSNSPTYRPPPRTKEVIINDQPIKLKYCFTCKIFRPPRASHCSLCDNCVDRFDHHCPWVGNCVGKRNYRFFYMFIVSLAFLCIYIFSCIITHLILLSKNSTLFDAIKKSPVSVVEGAICFFSVWSILGLAGFHSYLIMSNMTTNEDIKGLFSSKRNDSITNPYSKGSPMKNCFSVLCDPWSPSLINARDEVYCDENTLAAIKSGSFGNSSNSSKMMMPRPNLNAGGYPIQPHSFHTGGSYIAGSISATTPLPSYSHYGQQQYKMAYTDQSVGTGSGDLRHHHPLYYRPPPLPSQSQQSTSTDMNQFHNHHRGHQTEYNQYAVSGPGSCHRYHHQRQSSTPGTSKRLGSLTEQGSGSIGHNYSVAAATVAAAAPSSNSQLSNNQFYGSLKKPLAQQSQQPNQGSIGSTGRSHNSKQQQQYSISPNEYQPQSQQVQQQYSLLHTTPGTSAGSSSASTSSAVASKSPLTVSGNLLAQTSQQPRSSFSSSSGSTSCPAAQHHNHQQESSPVPGVRQNHNQTQQQPQSGQSRVHPDYHQSYYHHQGYN